MASNSSSDGKGEKITLMLPTMDHDQAERGGARPVRKRTGVSILGSRKQSFLRPQSTPIPPKPTARPTATRTGSTASFLPPTKGPDSMPALSQIVLLRQAAAIGDREMASAAMDRLKADDMLLSAGFTTQDLSGNGLLQMAARYGYKDMLEDFLLRGININGVDRNHGTALQAAIYMGQDEIVNFLLDWEQPRTVSAIENENHKVNVNTKGGYLGCALQVAAYRGNDDLIRKLLGPRYQADVNIAGGKYGSPLQAAVRTGRVAVVKLILDAKANVDFKGGKYGCALQAVARGPYRSRIHLAEISRGQALKVSAQISPDSLIVRQDKNLGDVNYVEVAELLFDKGARIDGQCGMFDNPINAAACSGSKPMLELMLSQFEHRATGWKEEKSVVYTKALLSAITHAPENQQVLVELLVENGAMIQYKTSVKLPNLPLEAAATKGLCSVVNYLLGITDSYGNFADTLAESGIHGTALRAAIAASKPGKEDTAECLINLIAEQWGVKSRSPSEPSNPLFNVPAGTSGHEPITRQTEEEKLDWTKWDAEYGNLLQLATVSGLKNTVELLLKYGADPNTRDTSQRTTLHIAAWFGFPKIVQIFLENNADVNARDEWGATPLDQAEESLDRKGHPGATEQDLQEIVQLLQGSMRLIDNEKPGMEFRGPKKAVIVAQAPTQYAKSVFSMPFWIPGVGFRATIVDIWESEEQECLLMKKPRVEEILYHRAVLDSIMGFKDKPDDAEAKIRWVHIPTNNMTWAEMVVMSICKDKGMPAYKSFWGADPFYASSDLSPHARFISPQCGRLVQDGLETEKIPEPEQHNLAKTGRRTSKTAGKPVKRITKKRGRPNKVIPKIPHLVENQDDDTEMIESEPSPLFMAMPYLHWEAYHSQKTVSGMIIDVKNESLKTSPTPEDKLPLWPSEKRKDSAPEIQVVVVDEQGKAIPEVPKAPLVMDRESLDNPDAEEDYLELLRRYLYKRRPVHLRRTLDQYYYSHLADTNERDADQVVMRQFNEDQKILRLEGDRKYKELLEAKAKLENDTRSSDPLAGISENGVEVFLPASELSMWQRLGKHFGASKQRKRLKDVDGKLHKIDQRQYYDDNSPVLMVDQLWLWVIDNETIVTSFPHRQLDRNGEDLDAADKTDVLKTVLSYLHSVRRPEINTSQDLADLIISQCVGVLHKSDMIPELDFLKKYSVQSNKWADQVMQMLSQFVKDFEEFMVWIKEQPAESEESIRWFESIFSVTEQTRLLRNIQDIIDELGMLKAVFDDQIQVLTGVDEEFEHGVLQKCSHGCPTAASTRCPHSSKALVDQSTKHLKHVERMGVQANQAYGTLKDLLNLKQQQAYVLEARVSRNEAISSGVQSKTIMVFTIVTIVFLPLTFVTSIFTLPIAEFKRVVLPAGSDFPPTPFLKKSYILKYMVGITFAIAIPLILAAFEIQFVLNGWKLLRLKMEKKKKEKELMEMKVEDDGMPDFLK